ncbi:hypothetical protein C2R22_12785 [Salinigranum rubrum]|uniref:CPBP family intramembrane metalloprotease n=1 Tax=Salinigranum rubrum TaxID=755307 RepID=A0A2I8VMU0_9EURY|nr:hypothetical protein [Salinigranum rubrum]AUV82409.1 hypothetical protein C2R22_12785 [Salinigranum rubrum]
MTRTTTAARRRFVDAGSAHPLVTALGVLVGWTFVTYILEGARLTLLRPEAAGDRLLYALVANVLVGTVLALWLRGRVLADAPLPESGFRQPRRTVAGVAVAFAVGTALYAVGFPPSTDPVVVANAFAQTLVVSTAEVVVCWVFVGVAVQRALRPHLGTAAATVGLVVVASLGFGLYHVAHSPPFNTPRMVALLSVIGVLTSLVFVVSRDLYATLVFHNFLAVTGVTRALVTAGELSSFTVLLPTLWLTALVTLAALVAADVVFVRRLHSSEPPAD